MSGPPPRRSDALPFVGGHDGEAWAQDWDGSIYVQSEDDDDWHLWDGRDGPQPPEIFERRQDSLKKHHERVIAETSVREGRERQRRISDARWTVGLIIALIVVVAIWSALERDRPSDSLDSSAFLACDHFANVYDDIANGLYSYDEMRAKVKEVYANAQYSESPGIAESARAMLASVTSGDLTGGFLDAADDFREACS